SLESPLFPTEQFSLEGVSHERGTRNDDERLRLAHRAHVKSPGEELLFRSGLALDEDGCGDGGELFDLRDGGAHRGALRRELAEIHRVALLGLEVTGVAGEPFAQAAIFAKSVKPLDRLP